ncbi:hypothetical protein WKH24_11080 [Pantoea agglomerans]|uniref:hypothetical protein n=1 Tax=Enterobacter agglomerans TaxID=549 RepID=UPI003C79E8A5
MRKVLRFLCHARIFLVLLPGYLTVPVVHALTGPVPYISGIQSLPGELGDYPYQVRIQWNLITGTGDVDVRIGSDGYIVFALCGSWADAYGMVCSGIGNIPVTAGMTWREASDLITKRFGNTGTFTQAGQTPYYSPDLCAGIGLSSEDTYIHSIPTWFPGTACTLAPPENYTCSQEVSSPSIDFGTVASNNIQLTKGSVILTTTCNAEGMVTITPGWGSGAVPMTTATGAGGIAARPYLEFAPVGSGATFKSKVGPMKQTLEFRLEKAGLKMDSPGYGTYTANAVFIFSYN